MFLSLFFKSSAKITRTLSLIGMLWIGGSLLSGCANEDPNAVASFKGWNLSVEELESEYERINGVGTFSQATGEQKAQFAQLLLDKALLVKLANDACPEPDFKRTRLDRVLYEKTLVREFLTFRRQKFELSEEEFDVALKLISREATVDQFTIRSEDFDKIPEEAKKGLSFEELAEKYATVTSPSAPAFQRTVMRLGQGPREFIRAIFLQDVPVGTIVGPVRTNRGIFIVKVIDIQPFDIPAAHPEAMDMARRVISDLHYIPYNKVYVDSLFAEAAVNIHHEQEPLIHERFAAYWDSIDGVRNLGETIDFQTLKAPTWMFSDEENALPLYEVFGTSYTVGDFVESLDFIDLDYWPTRGRVEKIAYQIEQRANRTLYQTEAEKVGFATNEFLPRHQRIKEQNLLSQYRDRHIATTIELTDEQLREEYERNPQVYQTANQVAFGILSFPPNQEAAANAAWEILSSGDPLAWYELGPAEQAKGTGVIYFPDTGLFATNAAPPDPSWVPFRDKAATLDTGELAPPLKSQHGFTIVRCNQRIKPQKLSFAEAESSIRTNASQFNIDSEIDRQMEEARTKYKATVYRERLGATAGDEATASDTH